MSKKNTLLITGIVCILSLCSGCGDNAIGEHTTNGMAAVEAVDYQSALKEFEDAAAKGENRRMLYRGQGIAYLGLSQYEDAVKSLEKALTYSSERIDDVDFDINYYLATAYYKQEQPEKAIDVYTAIINLRPKEKNAYYLRGVLELEQDDYKTAVVDFEKAMAVSKQDNDLILNIYQTLDENGYKEIGAGYLRTALKDGEASMSEFDKGRISYYLEDYENARIYLEKAKGTNGAEATLYLGMTYEKLGDYNYAVSVYNNYLTEHPEEPKIYNQLGLCKMKAQDYTAALQAYQSAMAIENNGMMQTLSYNEIVATEYLGDFQKAAVLMKAYLATYPDDQAALRENEFLKTR